MGRMGLAGRRGATCIAGKGARQSRVLGLSMQVENFGDSPNDVLKWTQERQVRSHLPPLGSILVFGAPPSGEICMPGPRSERGHRVAERCKYSPKAAMCVSVQRRQRCIAALPPDRSQGKVSEAEGKGDGGVGVTYFVCQRGRRHPGNLRAKVGRGGSLLARVPPHGGKTGLLIDSCFDPRATCGSALASNICTRANASDWYRRRGIIIASGRQGGRGMGARKEFASPNCDAKGLHRS